MEERRKNIKDLEQKKQEAYRSLTLMLENLGEALVSRAETGEGEAGALLGEYQRIQREIAEDEGAISVIQEDVLRLNRAGEALTGNDRALRECKEALGRLYAGLGERLLGDETHKEFTEPYRQQLDALEDKIDSLENRKEALDARAPANFVVQLGRNTGGLLLRSSLEKTRESLQRFYETVGEKFANREGREGREGGEAEAGGEMPALGEIGELRKQAGDLRAEGLRLKEEQRKIAGSLNIQGGPVKRTGALEKQISGLKSALRQVYGKYGELAREKERAGEWDALFEPENRLLLQTIEETRNHIGDMETRIKKIEASLAIDEERKTIAKMEKAISDHRGRIAAAEKAVGDLEERIRGAEQRIEELKQIEAYGDKN